MKNEECIKMLKAKLECLDRLTRGIFEECNSDMCDDCSLNYDQGNMGEQKETLRMAIKALEQEPCEDCISRAELLKAVDTWDKFGCDADTKLVPIKDCYVPYIHYDDVVKAIKGMPSIQPKTDVLDKIRAEIKALSNANPSYWHSGDMVEREEVFEIIDKYKAESEDKE